MPVNPFEGLAAPNPFISVGAANPFEALNAEEPDRGFLSSLVHETGRDLKGAAKTLIAPVGSLLEGLGFEAPVTFEDLTTRDLTGAGMVASMFVGGAVFGAAKSMLAGQGLAALGRGTAATVARREAARFAAEMGWAQRALLAGASEGVAGAFFGGVKPLDSEESRLESVLENSALFAGFGGGLSALGSGFKATVGQRLALLKGQHRTQLLAAATQQETSRQFLQEFAGVRFRAAETGAEAEIRRLADGTVQRITKNRDAASTETFASFGEAVADSFKSGFTERLGTARTKLDLTGLSHLDEGVLARVAEADGDITKALGDLELGGYKAARDLLAAHRESDLLLDWLGAETVTERMTLEGETALSPQIKQSIMRVVPKDVARRLGAMEKDSDFLREALKAGAVDIHNIADATAARTFLKELAANEYVPNGNFIFAARSPYDVTFLSGLISSRTLAKIHPEIQPFVDLSLQAAKAQDVGARHADKWLTELVNRIPRGKAEVAVRILDESQRAGSVVEARTAALEAAAATGDAHIIDFVTSATERLNHYRLRAVGKGRLGVLDEAAPEAVAAARQIITQVADATPDGLAAEQTALAALDAAGGEVAAAGRALLDDAGRAGYFPIVNVGGYHVSVNGVQFGGKHATFNDALKAASEHGEGTVFISPAAASVDASLLRTISPKEFGRLVKAIQEVEGVELKASEAAELLKQSGTVPSAGPRKFSQHLQSRKLGTRDFAEDPFTALRFYTHNMERTLAYDTFERQAASIVENIPQAKSELRLWAERETDLLLGRPTRAERHVQNIVQGLGLEATLGPRALKSFSGFVRNIESKLKLGGIWSGVINSTQYATATVAKLGTKYSAIGLEAILSPAKRAEALALLKEGNIDLGIHTLTTEGILTADDSVFGELRNAAARMKIGETKAAAGSGFRALENLWLLLFNGAEKMNRLGTFYGAYRKATGEFNMTREAALGYAEKIVRETQFDYSAANTPQLLAGPVGAVLGQFKSFFVHEVEMIAQMTPKERVKLLVSFQALGGLGSLLNMPGADLVDNASRFMFDQKMSEALKVSGGGDDANPFTRFAAFGLPGLRGLDISRSVGPGGIADLHRGWMGPGAGDLAAYGKFAGGVVSDHFKYGSTRPETWNAFLQKALPSQARRTLLGLDIIDSGEVRNPYSGKLVYRPDDRLRVGILQAIGAPTARMSQELAMDEVVQRKIDSYREARASYRQQVALALVGGRQAEAQAALERARASGVIFQPRDLRQAVRDYSSNARERREDRTPLALRDDLLSFYEEE